MPSELFPEEPAAATPQPAPPPDPAPPDPDPGPDDAAPVTEAAAPEAPKEPYLRELMAELAPDIDVSRFDNDEVLAAELIQAYRTLPGQQTLAQAGQRYLQYQNEFENWLSSQGQARQQPAATQVEPKLWEAPPYDPAWIGMVTMDANGNVQAKPGTPPDIPIKLMQYAQWQQHKQQELIRDPVGTLGPIIEHLAEKKARSIMESQLGSHAAQQSWNDFVKTNVQWIVHHDATGRPIFDGAGNPILTPQGQLFNNFVGTLAQAGVQDPVRQRELALMMVSSQLERASAAPGAAAPQKAKPAQNNLAARRTINHGSAPAASASGERDLSNIPLREALAQSLSSFPDAEFN